MKIFDLTFFTDILYLKSNRTTKCHTMCLHVCTFQTDYEGLVKMSWVPRRGGLIGMPHIVEEDWIALLTCFS